MKIDFVGRARDIETRIVVEKLRTGVQNLNLADDLDKDEGKKTSTCPGFGSRNPTRPPTFPTGPDYSRVCVPAPGWKKVG